jgi:WD40 repeat protein
MPDGESVLDCSPFCVEIRNPKNGAIKRRFEAIRDLDGLNIPAFRVAALPDGGVLTAHADGKIRGWDSQTGKPAWTIQAHENFIFGLAVTADAC